jgi:hypothetical protein
MPEPFFCRAGDRRQHGEKRHRPEQEIIDPNYFLCHEASAS